MTTRTPRQPRDFYETPSHYVAALQKVIGRITTGTIVAPCVGGGCLLSYLDYAPRVRVITNDLDPRCSADHHRDATRAASWFAWGRPEWAIENPPFTHELPILRHALQYADNVAFLARLSFLEPTIERRLFWSRWQSTVEVIVLPRYAFTKPSKDTMTCCWLVWRNIQPTGALPNDVGTIRISTKTQ